MGFQLEAPYQPMGDQVEAIRQLVRGFAKGVKAQTLLGVTGSGKTFTAANVINQLNKPTLILSHNKTLAAQLYSEFRGFFPANLVEYYVSYYDYYQPEAYLPTTDLYIEKDLAINAELEKLRLSTTAALLSGRRDVIVVSSVSCLYGVGNPEDFMANTIHVTKGDSSGMEKVMRRLVDALYSRNDMDLTKGRFRVRGDTLDVAVAYGDYAYRFVFWGDEVESIQVFDPQTGQMGQMVEGASIYPANIFLTTPARMQHALRLIQDDLVKQVAYFEDQGRPAEAKRLQDRVEYDMEMMRELGYCGGIENYSRYFDGRNPGDRPYCLLDYFPEDYLLIIDESHVTIPQVRAMYGGDRARKSNLVEYGFRLPAAFDNRPLRMEEFEQLTQQVMYMSATPADYELQASGGVIVEQLIRPTGLLDPPIEVRPSAGQVDDLLKEIRKRTAANERVLVTTLTKRMAESLTSYFADMHLKCNYIHSDVDTLERVAILEALRAGEINVLVGVNLLREGLDLPEVSLVAILDADKEGFLRSVRSLTQTAGRAARNVHGLVIMYADTVTESMQQTIDETARRRLKQMQYNQAHGVVPRQIVRQKTQALVDMGQGEEAERSYAVEQEYHMVAEAAAQYQTPKRLREGVARAERMMRQSAKSKDFKAAAEYRDLMFTLQAKLSSLGK